MKYYIALSSINVDNVLSSESISPISFYKVRNFGYRTFERLSEIPIMNDLLLFTEVPLFSINDMDQENYPTLIEIEDDIQLKEKLQRVKKSGLKNKIYTCNTTIYLTPWNCRILFFSQKAKAFTRINCESSLCNKLGHLFRFDIIKPGKDNLSDILNGIKINESAWDYEKVVIDININRIKGILYGFYLGYTKSTSQDVASLICIQKKIYNIVATAINNNGKISPQFTSKLIELEESYNFFDPRIKQLKKLWEEKILSKFSTDNDKKALGQVLDMLSIKSEGKQNFCTIFNIKTRTYKVTKTKPITNWVAYQKELSIYTKSIIHESQKENLKFSFDKLIKLKDDYSQLSFITPNYKRFNSILHQFFFNQVTSIEDIRLKKFEVATEYTKCIKSLILSNKEVWENSPESKYYNSLRINIKASEPFNLKEAPSIIDLSIAAFLLKGEDFGSLQSYLEENSVYDYKYVLSFWGAAIGYVDMPKTILKSIITPTTTFCEIYKQVNQLLFNTTIENSFPDLKEDILKINIPSQSNIQRSNGSSINTATAYISAAIDSVRKKLTKFNKPQTKAIEESKGASNSTIFLATLKKTKGCGPRSKIYKAFQTYFEGNTLRSTNYDLFIEHNIINELSCFKNANTKILKRLQNNWNYVINKRKERTERINFFINLCKKEGEGNAKIPSILNGFFTQRLAEICKKELQDKYVR